MEKRKRNNNRFDLLPEEIIHLILSFLPPEKAAQTSVLSKTWLYAWTTYPNLEFDQTLFYKRLQTRSGRISEQSKKNKFVKFVDSNLARYSKHNLPIKSFVLRLEVFTSEWASLVDKWLGTALDMGVKELSLTLMPLFRNRHRYRLPQKIFSAKQLTSLRVSGTCCNSELISISLEEAQALLGNLKSLHLSDVHLEEQTYRKLCFRSCPLIEELSGMNQKVLITDTPSLEVVTSIGYPPRERAPCITASQFLKSLTLFYSAISNTELDNLISQCPLLERLVLETCHALTRVNITSQTLKSLILDGCNGLANVKIDAPNLLCFRYTGHRIESVSLISSLSERFESAICLYLYGDLDTSSFVRISSLLASLNNCVEFCVNVWAVANICFNANEIPLLPDQPKVKSLIIRTFLRSKSKRFEALVDGLRWACHPENLETQKFGWKETSKKYSTS